MRVPLLLTLAAVGGVAGTVDAAPPKPKPYVPPRLEPEPPPGPADTAVVESPEDAELAIVARPAPGAPLLGTAPTATRLPVRGMWEAPSARGCPNRRWYALAPEGWVCSARVRATDQPPSEALLRVPDGRNLPWQYVMAVVPEGETVPLWASRDDLERQAPPLLQLRKGDTVAVRAQPLNLNGEPYHVAEDGRVLPVKGTTRMGEGSTWQGVAIGADTPLPFGWVIPAQAKVHDGPERTARAAETIARRTLVSILEEAGEGAHRRLRIGEGRWLRAVDVNEVRLLPRPAGTEGHPRWIDVDLGEQVLVAYEGERPVYATLISSGRAISTPRGNYPIWAKVAYTSMKSQPYEDETYHVDRVPWVLFFQAHNALHGAYWHDRFGVQKSHGCVNLAPRDARWVFEWVPPPLPASWSGTRSLDLTASVTVHVRNSKLRRPFVQERPIGPPDRELERAKLEEAEARRLQAATPFVGPPLPPAATAAGAASPAPPGPAPAPPPGPGTR